MAGTIAPKGGEAVSDRLSDDALITDLRVAHRSQVGFTYACLAVQDRLLASRKLIADLRAVADYAVHDSSCSWWLDNTPIVCTCGLDDTRLAVATMLLEIGS